MRKRVHIALAVLLAILAGVIGWQVLRLREPVYQGKPLSVWLARLSVSARPMAIGDPEDMAAIRHIGTNALPILIERLQAQDKWLKQVMMRSAMKQKLVHFNLQSADERRHEALWGYEALGPIASGQVPRLSAILTNDSSSSVRLAAASALESIGPAARLAAPALFRATKDNYAGVRNYAFSALGEILPDPHVTIPVLVEGLDDPCFGVRETATGVLGKYGPEARAAVPALLRVLATNNADGFEKDVVGSVLKAIDPEAAAKAGVK